MKPKMKLREWRQGLLCAAAGACLLFDAELIWASQYNFFLVHKDEAARRRAVGEAYTRVAADPIDEFEGLGPDDWRK